MRVLIVAFDLFKNIGGGETVYQRIVSSLPEVDFTYLTYNIDGEQSHPDNAHPVLVPWGKELQVKGKPGFPQYILGQLREADRVAQAVAGQSFDLVDIPDYQTFGAYLRSAFAHHRVAVGSVVLAMHGNISTSIRLNWDTMGQDVSDLKASEKVQFQCADSVYSISRAYIDEWCRRVDRRVEYIDPMCFVNHGDPADWQPSTTEEPVQLACIGRSERRKGNDIFVDMMRWCTEKQVSGGVHIGGVYHFSNGVGSDYHLSNLAENRSIEVPYLYSKNRKELNALYSQRTIVVLPVRYDTLNLVVLEALFSGCPVAVSTKAGVCRYLDEKYPEIPYLKIDFSNYAGSIRQIEALAADYDNYRQKLHAALKKIGAMSDAGGEMRRVYQSAGTALRNPNTIMLEYEYRRATVKEKAIRLCRETRLVMLAKVLRPSQIVDRVKRAARKHLSAAALCWYAEIREAKEIPQRYWSISGEPENTKVAIFQKIHAVEGIHNCRFFHCYAYYELSRLLQKVNNQELWATYALRIMRLSGKDIYGQLPAAVQALKNTRHSLQAETAQLMYSGAENTEEQVYDWLSATYQKWRINPTLDACTVEEDFRNDRKPRVSIIVSLYNAADKLNFFLSMLARQTLVPRGEVEFIFVDSCSPMDEYSVLMKHKTMNMLYLRSLERETIQKAWNRAIPYARADYITFLGVDEMIYPDALELLSAELDADPDLDWVVGNSLVEAVEMSGIMSRDVMLYDRHDGIRFSSCLETCYLTYVGGLYRKNVHDRFGYYNEEYRGAGDTEFKNRILKHIRVKYLNRTLGVFLDYPQERVTASSMAEIEDLSAWYIFRSPGGIRYQYELASPAEIEEVLCWSLSYRKSFRREKGSDIEYAYNIADYLLKREPENALAKALLPGLKLLLEDLRELDSAELSLQNGAVQRRLHQIKDDFERVTKEHRRIVQNSEILYTYYNDNRYQQHRWLWASESPEAKEQSALEEEEVEA